MSAELGVNSGESWKSVTLDEHLQVHLHFPLEAELSLSALSWLLWNQGTAALIKAEML